MSNIFPENLYSSYNGKELLKSLIGQKIIRMFHYYLGNHEEFHDYLQNLSLDIPRDQIFSSIEGPLLVEFDSGVELSFFAEEPMQSIAFFLERNSKGEYIDQGTFCKPLDQESNPFVDVNDVEFSNEAMRAYLHKKIVNIKLYRKDRLLSTSSYRIKDSVISFVFEDSQQMTLGYNILKLSSVMTVVPWGLIPSDVRDNLFEVPIF
jgi:hypothetical protein